MMKKIIFTKHAEERLKMRKINEQIIKNALENPDEIVERDGIKINHKDIEDKTLRVVYREEANCYIVVTTYLTQKGRYKRGGKNEDII
jgi:hypothetical protein